ncbi:hypothetical protein [Nocardioides sp.]|uniref:hypothetical protein n=1 Tax=Nocardioides sp. TaxID=35761 RepID=UPI000C91E36D|nr:hypothetical protein [Nocardioides sp.]MAS55254.1 hypothetical protein [Pimelobacter sp.]MDE0776070.1 hypothetical protein [Nocardioides sp.]
MTAWIVVIGTIVLGLPLLVWVSHRMLTTAHRDGTGGSGGSDAFGAIVDVFEPARARADADLESHKTMRQPLPAPGDDPGPPQIIDGTSIRIRRPRG